MTEYQTYINDVLITSPGTCSNQYYRTQSPKFFWNMIEKTCSLVCKILVHRDTSCLELFQLETTNQLKIESCKVISVKEIQKKYKEIQRNTKTKKYLTILREGRNKSD